MNTSKLHIIAKALQKEMTRVGVVESVAQIIEALSNQIQQPQQVHFQQELSEQLTNLYQKLDGSPIDNLRQEGQA